MSKSYKVNEETRELEPAKKPKFKNETFYSVEDGYFEKHGAEDLYSKRYKTMLKLWSFNYTMTCVPNSIISENFHPSKVLLYMTKGE